MYCAVDRFTWKVIKDPDTSSSVTIFVVNNPHLDVVPKNDLCTDICSELSWVTWDIADIRKGVTFCCNTRELKDKILPFLPNEAL